MSVYALVRILIVLFLIVQLYCITIVLLLIVQLEHMNNYSYVVS